MYDFTATGAWHGAARSELRGPLFGCHAEGDDVARADGAARTRPQQLEADWGSSERQSLMNLVHRACWSVSQSVHRSVSRSIGYL